MVSKFFKFILLNLHLADEVKFYSGINLKFEYKITKLKTRKIDFNKNLNKNLKKEDLRRSGEKVLFQSIFCLFCKCCKCLRVIHS